MRAYKLTSGIVSIVLSIFIVFQSSIAGLANALEENGEVGGTAGLLLAICYLVAGILALVANNKDGKINYVPGGFWAVGSIIAFMTAGSYTYLYIWATIAIVFAVVIIIGTARKNKKNKTTTIIEEN